MLDDLPTAASPRLAEIVHDLMPQLTTELTDLVRIPSVSEFGFPESTREHLLRAKDMISTALLDVGCRVSTLTCPIPRRSS